MRQQVDVFLAGHEVEAQLRRAVVQTGGEVGHADQAAGDVAGLDVDLAAGLVAPHARMASVQALCDGAVLASAARGQLARHPDVVFVDGVHHPVQRLSFGRQDAGLPGGRHVLEGALCGRTDVAAGAVPAVVADIEGLVAPGRRGLGGRDVFVGVVHAGGAVRILPDGVFVSGLGSCRQAEQQDGAGGDQAAGQVHGLRVCESQR